jgi:prevent-host-death family protein
MGWSMQVKTIGSFEAKTHFSQILTEVINNEEEIIITRHGKPLAILSPYKSIKNNESPAKMAIMAIEILREECCLNQSNQEQLSIKDMINEGRA